MDVGLVSMCFGQGNMSESNSRPARVKGGSGKLVLPAEGSIVVAPADEAALKSVATVLAQDLKDLLDWNYTIRTGKPGKNDIYLSLMKPDKQLGEEGYVLTAGRYAGIEAPARQGAFWGTRSLLQILYNEKGQLPKGVARDWPQYPSRGFMLDVGRKVLHNGFPAAICQNTIVL